MQLMEDKIAQMKSQATYENAKGFNELPYKYYFYKFLLLFFSRLILLRRIFV